MQVVGQRKEERDRHAPMRGIRCVRDSPWLKHPTCLRRDRRLISMLKHPTCLRCERVLPSMLKRKTLHNATQTCRVLEPRGVKEGGLGFRA
jgi:hypothetical protein